MVNPRSPHWLQRSVLTVAPARHWHDIDPWLVVTICSYVAACLLRGPSRGVSQLQARGSASLRILALLCCVSTASGSTGSTVIPSQDNLDICIPGASSVGGAPGLSDLCTFSNENQLPATSFTHDSGDSIGSQNISSTSPEVNFTTSSYYATLVIPFCCDDAPGTPMGPDTGMEYDLARREVAVADTCSRFSTEDVPVTLITDSHCGTESLDGPRAVQRRPPAISSNSAHHRLMAPVLCGKSAHGCIQDISSLIDGVKFFTMTSPMNDSSTRSDPLSTEASGTCALIRPPSCVLTNVLAHPCPMPLCTGAHLSGSIDTTSHDAKPATRPLWPPSTRLAPRAPSTKTSWLSRAGWVYLAVAFALMVMHSCHQQQKGASSRRPRRNSKKKRAAGVKALCRWVHRDSASTKWQCVGMACLLLLPHGRCAAYALSTAPTESRPPAPPSSPDGRSTSVTSIGMVETEPIADGTALVLYRSRQLSDVTTVSTVAELIEALIDSTVDKIVMVAGTYEFGSTMAGCTDFPAALCISRAVTIEAEVEGGVVLDGMGARRVITVESGGAADLIGLHITRGYASGVSSHSEPY